MRELVIVLRCRLWIKYPRNLSVAGKFHVSQYPMVSCTALSQGCSGGYIFLALKSASGKKRGLPSQDCIDKYDEIVNKKDGLSMLSIAENRNHPRGKTKTLESKEKKCYDIAGVVSRNPVP